MLHDVRANSGRALLRNNKRAAVSDPLGFGPRQIVLQIPISGRDVSVDLAYTME
jgi:hypothetical protein